MRVALALCLAVAVAGPAAALSVGLHDPVDPAAAACRRDAPVPHGLAHRYRISVAYRAERQDVERAQRVPGRCPRGVLVSRR